MDSIQLQANAEQSQHQQDEAFMLFDAYNQLVVLASRLVRLIWFSGERLSAWLSIGLRSLFQLALNYTNATEDFETNKTSRRTMATNNDESMVAFDPRRNSGLTENEEDETHVELKNDNFILLQIEMLSHDNNEDDDFINPCVMQLFSATWNDEQVRNMLMTFDQSRVGHIMHRVAVIALNHVKSERIIYQKSLEILRASFSVSGVVQTFLSHYILMKEDNVMDGDEEMELDSLGRISPLPLTPFTSVSTCVDTVVSSSSLSNDNADGGEELKLDYEPGSKSTVSSLRTFLEMVQFLNAMGDLTSSPCPRLAKRLCQAILNHPAFVLQQDDIEADDSRLVDGSTRIMRLIGLKMRTMVKGTQDLVEIVSASSFRLINWIHASMDVLPPADFLSTSTMPFGSSATTEKPDVYSFCAKGDAITGEELQIREKLHKLEHELSQELTSYLCRGPSVIEHLVSRPDFLTNLVRCGESDWSTFKAKEFAYCTLTKMAILPANAQRMIAHQDLMDSMLRHLTSLVSAASFGKASTFTSDDGKTVDDWSCIVLLVLCNNGDNIKEQLFHNDALIHALTQVALPYSANSLGQGQDQRPMTTAPSIKTKELAIGLLMVLLTVETNRSEPKAMGLLQLFIRLLQANESPSIREHSVLALSAMSLVAETRTTMARNAKLVECLMDLLKGVRHPDQVKNDKVLERAVNIVNRLHLTLDALHDMRVVVRLYSSFRSSPSSSSLASIRQCDPTVLRSLKTYLY